MLDAGGPLLFVLVGLPIALVAITGVVVVEAVLLRLMHWEESFGRCLVHSLAINAVSSLVGCGLVFVVQAFAIGQVFNAGFIVIAGLAFVSTVVVEAILLRALKRVGRVPWRTALAINFLSYVLLAVFAVLGMNR